MTFMERFDAVLQMVASTASGPPSSPDRALLMVYEPDQEQDFRTALSDFLTALTVRRLPSDVADLRQLPYQVLETKGLLPKSFELQARQPDRFRQDLARRLEPAVVELICERSRALGSGLLVLRDTTALFPWVSYSSVMKQLPSDLPSMVLVPFPGTETGSQLRFVGRRNGFDYLARRV